MVDREIGDVEDPMATVLATLGLLLMFVAVISLVMGLASLGLGGHVFGVVSCVIAVVSFVGSLACFLTDGKRLAAAEAGLPFPSMLRNP
ncbi:hypothetical protein CIW52_15315 [Mycolicibacterium sp. P9-64]|uniref:hypothetical protein n=1 Tax=Mycolicibacterium sp. P9-64 TaxID=2024612 RepID=UPI0011F085D2|nr:hypothetical protein [Mycolicibacterium sp. P9-64]KAA0082381.1 hypothetical protein CIW52_15315 [Mycolicibacterium sp. P9-64]